MDDERVERVAEVIRDSYDLHQQAKGYGPLVPWRFLSDARKEKWHNMARSAIEVMEED